MCKVSACSSTVLTVLFICCFQLREDIDELLKSEEFVAQNDNDRVHHLYAVYKSTKVQFHALCYIPGGPKV